MTNLLFTLAQDYASAVLLAILPAISQFGDRLQLDLPVPLLTQHVANYVPHRIPGQFGGLVVLNSGHRFLYQGGIVQTFESPDCFSTLQDPQEAWRFVGESKLTADQAEGIARASLKRLGHDPGQCFIMPKPTLAAPQSLGNQVIPHFLFTWIDPRNGTGRIIVEVNGRTKRIERLQVQAPELQRPPPSLSQPFSNQQTADAELDRRRAITVPPDERFLEPLLPQMKEWSDKLGIKLPDPLLTNIQKIIRYPALQLVDVWLNTGERFRVQGERHLLGYFTAESFFPKETARPVHEFLGQARLTETEGQAIARQALAKLGYLSPTLGLDKPARVRRPVVTAGAQIPRLDFSWVQGENLDMNSFAAVEVNTETGQLTSIRISVPPQKISPP